jgi:hypothetical protein
MGSNQNIVGLETAIEYFKRYLKSNMFDFRLGFLARIL